MSVLLFHCAPSSQTKAITKNRAMKPNQSRLSTALPSDLSFRYLSALRQVQMRNPNTTIRNTSRKYLIFPDFSPNRVRPAKPNRLTSRASRIEVYPPYSLKKPPCSPKTQRDFSEPLQSSLLCALRGSVVKPPFSILSRWPTLVSPLIIQHYSTLFGFDLDAQKPQMNLPFRRFVRYVGTRSK
jgi:hypothetical protein